MTIETGTKVKLKIGGALMIVRRVVDERYALNTGYNIGVHCDWHDANNVPHTRVYHEAQLEIVPEARRYRPEDDDLVQR